MANPPRKAKRLRELAFREQSGDPIVPPPYLQSSSRAPTPPPTTTSRRGRKPAGPLSKSAREQLRKTNHSVIEKRRREKINEALAALRVLVPHDKDGEKKEEKEFKLEILVRTVDYLTMMVARVNKLEAGTCRKCDGSLSATTTSSSLSHGGEVSPTIGKRKRPSPTEHVDENMKDDLSSEHDDIGRVTFTPAPRQPVTSPHPPMQSLPRLPSISSWMRDSSSDPPPLHAHAFQLPSPPRTVPFVPTNTSTGFLPGLALPSPIEPGIPSGYQPHLGTPDSARVSPLFVSTRAYDPDVPELPLDAAPQQHHQTNTPTHTHDLSIASLACSGSNQLSTFGRASTSDAGRRPSWTRDDRTAASLLLTMSYRSSAADRSEPPGRCTRGAVLEAQTPSSMLGMVEAEGHKL